MQDKVSLTIEGVVWTQTDGATGVLHWNEIRRWREGTRVLVFDNRDGMPAVFVSIARLAEFDRQRLRDMLRSQIPVLSP
jgi:hypothetical protein